MKNSNLIMKPMSNYDDLKIWNKCNLESYTTITMHKIMTSALFEHMKNLSINEITNHAKRINPCVHSLALIKHL